MSEDENRGSLALIAKNLSLTQRANELIRIQNEVKNKPRIAPKDALRNLKSIDNSASMAFNVDCFVPYMYKKIMIDRVYNDKYFRFEFDSDNILSKIFASAVTGRLQFVREAVISGKFDINSQDAPYGNTLLHYLAPTAPYETIKFVLDLPGTDPTLLNLGGRSAAEIAIRSSSPREVCTLLTDAECRFDLNWRDPPEFDL